MTVSPSELHVHVHVSVDGVHDLKELIMTTKEELLAEVADLKALAVENNDDIARVLAKLDEAIANGDLTAVAEAVADLRATVQSGNDAIEAAVPEGEEPPPVP